VIKKETEKILKYKDLSIEIQRMWMMMMMMIIIIIIIIILQYKCNTYRM